VTDAPSEAVFYLDTSALVKRYVIERGSSWLAQLCSSESGGTIATALITQAEAAAAFARKTRDGTLLSADYTGILQDLAHDFAHEYVTVEISRGLVARAVDLTTRHKLRGYDAVQLAAALELNSILLAAELAPATFVGADDQLLAAAQSEGLLIANPNDY
jgi:predicted nucleic acid-binding protein